MKHLYSIKFQAEVYSFHFLHINKISRYLPMTIKERVVEAVITSRPYHCTPCCSDNIIVYMLSCIPTCSSVRRPRGHTSLPPSPCTWCRPACTGTPRTCRRMFRSRSTTPGNSHCDALEREITAQTTVMLTYVTWSANEN